MGLLPLMAIMAMKVKIPGVGDRSLVIQPLYRKVDSTGRVFLSTDLAGKTVLALACLPEYPTDKKFQPMAKSKVPVDLELLQKDVIISIIQNIAPTDYKETLAMVFKDQGWDEPTKEEYRFHEEVISEILEWIWSEPLNSWNDGSWDDLAETLQAQLLEECDERDVSIIYGVVSWAKEAFGTGLESLKEPAKKRE